MIKSIEGNILDAKSGFIVHQVNPDGVMGGGLARMIADKWPVVLSDYKKLCGEPGDKKFSYTKVDDGLWVANLFTQKSLAQPMPRTLYENYPPALQALKLQANGWPIHIPFGLGCGLGGGDWNVVMPLIHYYLGYEDVTIWKFNPS